MEKYPGQYEQTLRTVQRRVQTWKAVYGDPKEVMFEIRHLPGEMGLSDFTELKDVTITIGGQAFEHILYHYRLVSRLTVFGLIRIFGEALANWK